jgi:hypothetical protein
MIMSFDIAWLAVDKLEAVNMDPESSNQAVILDDPQVDEITSDDPTKLDEIVNNNLETKRKNEYSVRSFYSSFRIPM